MMAAKKDFIQLRRKLKCSGYTITPSGSGHYRVTDSSGKFVTMMGATVSDRKAVLAVQTQIARVARGHYEPPQVPEQSPAPEPEQEDSRLSKEDRRAIQAAIDEQERRVAERVNAPRQKRPPRPAPKSLPERVRLSSKGESIGLGLRAVRNPHGGLSVFSAARLDGHQIRRSDLHPVDGDPLLNSGCFACARLDCNRVIITGTQLEIRDQLMVAGCELHPATQIARAVFTLDRTAVHIVNGELVALSFDLVFCDECVSRAGMVLVSDGEPTQAELEKVGEFVDRVSGCSCCPDDETRYSTRFPLLSKPTLYRATQKTA